MKDSTVLRTARIGGFNKEDVLTYVDELNAKIDSLKTDLENEKAKSIDTSELDQYKNEIVELNKKLEDSNAKLAASESNCDRMNKEIAQLTMDFEAQKQQLIAEKNKLEADLENVNSQSMQQVQSAAGSFAQADTSELDNKIIGLESKLSSTSSILTEKENRIAELEANLSAKEREIERLKIDLNELKLNSDSGSYSGGFDMGALFSEAQMTAKKVVVEARMASDKLVSDARTEAENIRRDASYEAEKVNSDAQKSAEKIKSDARKGASDTIKNSEYAKSLLRKEIDRIKRHFEEFSDSISRAAAQSEKKLQEAQNILNRAHDIIDGESELNTAISDIKSEGISAAEPEPLLSSISYTPQTEESPYITPITARDEVIPETSHKEESGKASTEINESDILPNDDEVDLFGDFKLPDELAKFAMADDDIEAAEAAEKKANKGITGFGDLSSLAELAEAAAESE